MLYCTMGYFVSRITVSNRSLPRPSSCEEYHRVKDGRYAVLVEHVKVDVVGMGHGPTDDWRTLCQQRRLSNLGLKRGSA